MLNIALIYIVFTYANPVSMNNTAYNLLQNGEIKKAEKEFTKLIIIYPDFVTAYNNLGIVYLKLKKYKLAEKMFSHAIKVNNRYSKAYYNLATTYFREKKYTKSIEILKKLYKIDKEYLKKRFKKQKAIKEIKEKLKEDPDNKVLIKSLKLLENH